MGRVVDNLGAVRLHSAQELSTGYGGQVATSRDTPRGRARTEACATLTNFQLAHSDVS